MGDADALFLHSLIFPFQFIFFHLKPSKCKFIKTKTSSQLPCTCNGARGLWDLLDTRSLLLMQWYPRHRSQGLHCPSHSFEQRKIEGSISAQHREGIKLPPLPLWSRTTHIIQVTTSGEKTRSSQEADHTKCWSSLQKLQRK